MEERRETRTETEKTAAGEAEKTRPAERHNWVTNLYDRANISVRQLNILLVCLLGLIVALFVIFGK